MSKQIEQTPLFHDREGFWFVRRHHDVIAPVVKRTLTTMPTTASPLLLSRAFRHSSLSGEVTKPSRNGVRV
jgi:hypothetical protein